MIKKILIGLAAGFVSGMFATGGGMILVPSFMYILEVEGKLARGTSVFCILPMVVVSSIFYYQKNYIDWNVGIYVAIGGCIGGFIGAKLLKILPEKYIKILFTCFLIYASFKFIFS